MRLRDDVEMTLRDWNVYEIGRSAPPVIDFDCAPRALSREPLAVGRLESYEKFKTLSERAVAAGDRAMDSRVQAHLAYLEALFGMRPSLEEYVQRTQGCAVSGWSDQYLENRRQPLAKRLEGLGIPWDKSLRRSLEEYEGSLDLADVGDVITAEANRLEPQVRKLTGSSALFDLSVEVVNIDDYWSYWLDGAGAHVRMRINERNASFTVVQARQFAMHEILGHGLQCASFTQTAEDDDVDWVRLTSVHAQQQVMLEGLAQALPLFATPNDEDVCLRVALGHYSQLVLSQIHVALNHNSSVEDCLRIARAKMPWWTDEQIADILTDRGNNPLLRSYLWSYPAGVDWFVRLAETGDEPLIQRIFRAAYSAPLTPDQLISLWPDGPHIGGEEKPDSAHRH